MVARKRRPISYVFLGVYVLLSAFIIVESSIPGGASSAQSNFFARIGAALVNFFNGPIEPNVIEPTSIKLASDSSYLGQEGEVSNVAIGTTSLFSFEVTYPEKKQEDVYNYAYQVERASTSDAYTYTVSSHSNSGKFYVDVRVTGNEITSQAQEINVKIGEDQACTHTFKVVDLPAPTSFSIKENDFTLKKGESAQIDMQLLGEGRDDAYLRRYFDPRKIAVSSSDSDIAYIDEYGVIHAEQEGSAILAYGDKEIQVTVINESIYIPENNALSISLENPAKSPFLLDYDFVFDDKEGDDDYGMILYPSFDVDTLEDKSVSWDVDNPLSVKLAPHHYDEEGFPVYNDEEGNPCIRAVGYRKKGETTISCYSNADKRLHAETKLIVGEAIPTSLTLTGVPSSKTINVNETFSFSASFLPKNVSNTKIHAVSSDDSIVSILRNDSTSITVKGLQAGECRIQATSITNPEISASFDVKVKLQETINTENYDDFHGFIRKALGHFLLFLVTGVFGFLFVVTFFEKKNIKWATLGLVVVGFLTAGLSELVQYFVPHRSGLWSDVGIDTAGHTLGVLLTILIVWFTLFIRSKIKKK